MEYEGGGVGQWLEYEELEWRGGWSMWEMERGEG